MKSNRNLLLAQADLNQQPGVVLDYLQINDGDGYGSGGYSMTLTGGTYLVSSDVYFDDLYFNTNVVVKYAGTGGSGGGGCLHVGATHVGADYDYNQPFNVVFTSKDDNSVGEIIDGSTGSPYGTCTALVTDAGTNSILNFGATFSYLATGVVVPAEATLKWCNFKACDLAIMQDGTDTTLSLWHCRIEHGWAGIQNSSSYGDATIQLMNVLFGACDSPILVNGDDVLVTAENMTADSYYDFFYGWANVTFNLTNSIFNHEIFGASVNAVVFDADFSGSEFQSSGNNNYYLAASSSYRDAGAYNMNITLAGQIQSMTTHAPQDGSHPDTSQPDLGYHYPISADSDSDGLLDTWELAHFGNMIQTGTSDYDGDGDSDLTEYQNATDPNTIRFGAHFANLYVSNRAVTGGCTVQAGVPYQKAVLINSTNLASASWTAYSSNLSFTLPDADTNHMVLVALRGRVATNGPAKDFTELTLDRVPPVLAITNPILASAAATVLKPYLQLQGYANEVLASLSYDLTNEFGLVTNELVAVVDQFFDTNRFDFTTNWFQGYDIALAMNENLITLRVADRAGNVTTTNFNVALDYSTATNPPVLALLWPTNGMHLSGDSFYIRGKINDETAQVAAELVDTNGVTNVVAGIVERNTMFWVEDLPLVAGTNVMRLIATDAAGNVSSTNLSVVKSSVILTITSTPEGAGLYEPTGAVSGTVSDTNFTVSVNGVAAAVDEAGNWTAASVPNYGQGTVTYDVVAALSGGGGASSPPVGLSGQREMEAMVKITKHSMSLNQVNWSGSYSLTTRYDARYDPGLVIGLYGVWLGQYQGSADQVTIDDMEGIYAIFSANYAWSDIDPVGTVSGESTPWGSFGPEPIASSSDIKNVPYRSFDHLEHSTSETYYFDVAHYFGKGVRHSWPWGASQESIVTLGAHTTETLYTGGKAGIARKNLFCLNASAKEYKKPLNFPWSFTPGDTVVSSRIEILGKALGSDGKLWTVQPDNASIDVTAQVKGAKHFNAGVGAQKYKSHFTAFVTMPNPGGPKWQVFSWEDRAGHCWWRFSSDAPIEGLLRVGVPMGTAVYLNQQVGYFPINPALSVLYPTPGILKDEGNGDPNVWRVFRIGFDQLVSGLNFTYNLSDDPGMYGLGLPFYLYTHHCVSTTIEAGAEAEVVLPDESTPQNMGVELGKYPTNPNP